MAQSGWLRWQTQTGSGTVGPEWAPLAHCGTATATGSVTSGGRRPGRELIRTSLIRAVLPPPLSLTHQ